MRFEKHLSGHVHIFFYDDVFTEDALQSEEDVFSCPLLPIAVTVFPQARAIASDLS